MKKQLLQLDQPGFSRVVTSRTHHGFFHEQKRLGIGIHCQVKFVERDALLAAAAFEPSLLPGRLDEEPPSHLRSITATVAPVRVQDAACYGAPL